MRATITLGRVLFSIKFVTERNTLVIIHQFHVVIKPGLQRKQSVVKRLAALNHIICKRIN